MSGSPPMKILPDDDQEDGAHIGYAKPREKSRHNGGSHEDVPKDAKDEVVDEDDEPEDEEDDDEEDEDDEEGGRGRRRKRRKRNIFLDVEAEVDDDEEDLDEDEDEIGAQDGFIQDQEEEVPEGDDDDRRAARHNELDRRRQIVDEENYREIAEQMKDKYGRSAPKYRGDTDVIPQRLLMPSVRDASLWLVKCKPGKERDIVMSLMRKVIDMESKGDPLEILSVFERDSLPGYLYLEARRQAHVQKAISGLINVYGSKIVLVPIDEMADLLKIKKKEIEVVPGGWVRIKRGKYAGDLAQVIDVTESGDAIRIKMIPRLDLNPKDMESTLDKKRKKGSAASVIFRPPQKFFNPDEVRRVFGNQNIQKRGRAFIYNNDYYENGYLEKDVPRSGLELENVNPTLDEITRFTQSSQDDEAGVDLSTLNMSGNSHQINSYLPGDHVEVYEGEQLGVHGIVEKIEGDIVTVVPENDELRGSKVEIPSRSLRKRFKQGDHVKVMGGRYKDETGLIVRIVDNVVTLLSDLSLKELSVFSKDLQEASEIATGANALGGLELYDLVQLDVQTAGVIVRVERDSLKVLDQGNSVRTVQPHQVTKMDSRRAVALDKNGVELRVGDTVSETDNESRQGTILHIYKGIFVWLRNRDLNKNGGVFVARTTNLTSSAPTAKNGGPDLTKMNPAAMMAPYGQPKPVAPQYGGGGRDRMRGRTVSIVSGPFKGYMGIVKEVNGELARVELHTNMRTITVKSSILLVKDSTTDGSQLPGENRNRYTNGQQGGGGGYGGGGSHGGAPNTNRSSPQAWDSGSLSGRSNRSPSWGGGSIGWGGSIGSRTPSWQQDGGRTPLHIGGGQTPNPYNDGGRTPAWDSGSKTPRRVEDGGRTPAWNPGSRTPAWNNDDAWGSGNSKSNTDDAGVSGNSKSNLDDSWDAKSSHRESWGTPTPWGDQADTPAPSNWDAPTPAPVAAPTPAPSGGWAAPTPAAYPSTPAAYPSTPAAYPSTPGAYTTDTYDAPTPAMAHTPGPMGAPTPGPYHGAPTPYSAPTPAYQDMRTPGPMTPAPGVAATPAPSSWSRDVMPPPNRSNDLLENWLAPNIEVKIGRHRRTRDLFEDGKYDQQHAEVIQVESGGVKATVRVLSNDDSLVISSDYLTPVPPERKGERARVLAGPLRNHIGTMLSINHAEGEGSITSKAKGNSFEVVELRFIARMPDSNSEE